MCVITHNWTFDTFLYMPLARSLISLRNMPLFNLNKIASSLILLVKIRKIIIEMCLLILNLAFYFHINVNNWSNLKQETHISVKFLRWTTKLIPHLPNPRVKNFINKTLLLLCLLSPYALVSIQNLVFLI